MFQVSGQNIENFFRNSYFQVGGLHVRVRVLILVCDEKCVVPYDWMMVFKGPIKRCNTIQVRFIQNNPRTLN